MKNRNTQSLFALPESLNAASQTYFALVFVGFAFVPMLFITYDKFLKALTGIETRDFFFLFSFVFIVIISVISTKTKSTSLKLRKSMNIKMPNETGALAVQALSTRKVDFIVPAEKYWFWQLIHAYFFGVAIAWLFLMFYLFFI